MQAITHAAFLRAEFLASFSVQLKFNPTAVTSRPGRLGKPERLPLRLAARAAAEDR